MLLQLINEEGEPMEEDEGGDIEGKLEEDQPTHTSME